MTDERELIEWWKQHYDEHLNDAEAEHKGSRRNGFISTADEVDVTTFTIDEIVDAIKLLKNNKAAGKDGIGAELIKMGPDMLATCLQRLIARIWDTKQLPEE